MTVRIAYSVSESAEVAGVSRDTIRRAINSTDGNGEIPHLPARRVGTRLIVLADDLTAWLQALPEA